MTTSTAAVTTKDLSVSYGSHHVLSNISLTIPRDAIVAIIGPNGSGKTTFVKAVLGLITPNSGSVSIMGKTPRDARKLIAYVPQRFTFDQETPITVAEFLALSLTPKNQSNYEPALDHFQITKFENSLLGQLSGGQLQRVLLARAFIQQPAILFLDEPGAGIDMGGEKSFYDLVEHLHAEHDMTIIMISHEVDVVSRYATHILCLGHEFQCFHDTATTLQPDVLKKLYNADIQIIDHHQND